MINQHELAKRVAAKEGGKVNMNIAQIKEVLRLVLDELAKERFSDVIRLLERRAWRQ